MSAETEERKRKRHRYGNPDFRPRVEVPLPPIEELQQRLYQVLQFGLMMPLRQWPGSKFRDRILTLPVMMAIVVTMVCRKLPTLSAVLRAVANEMDGFLYRGPLKVSKQAVSKRLARLPVELFARLFDEALERLRAERQKRESVQTAIPPEWREVCKHFPQVWIADGSTLEALKKRMDDWKGQSEALGGKIMMLVEAFTSQPVAAWYTKDCNANDKSFYQKLFDRLPRGGLLIFDLGFFSFPAFDAMTEKGQFFVTRLREKTSYQVEQVLSQGPRYRDQIIRMGKHRKYPCLYLVRMISVLWGTTWHHYLTNGLDPSPLSPRQVCALYRRRWRIEQAFLLTKRLLGLSYLWAGSLNGVQIQIYATWIFYAVLLDLCQQVAEALNLPLERISVELVFGALYYFSRELLRHPDTALVPYLAQRALSLNLVKAVRHRHRLIDQMDHEIWAFP